MSPYRLQLTFKSDALLGMGEGLAGWVDAEVRHDPDGCPYLAGRTLRGLLVEECSGILYSLRSFLSPEEVKPWEDAAQFLFGNPGSSGQDRSCLHVGDAELPEALRRAVHASVEREELTPAQVLDSLTAVRRQTALDYETGAPRDNTLRAVRVLLRGITLEAGLAFLQPPEGMALPLLAACIRALRRAGTGRNRGRGELAARLLDEAGEDLTETEFARFRSTLLQKSEGGTA